MTHLDPLGSPARWVQVDDRRAIARSDTNAVLGIFGSGYVMHQYATWLLSTVANILDDDLVVSSAGLLRGGAIAWVEVSVPETITTPVGFDFRPNLLATTSFDGSISTTFKRTVTATVCDNTMDLALAEKGQHYKVKHTRYSSSKISAAREALAVVHTLADDFAKELAILANTPSANPSGGPSWTRTSPSTTARVTPSKAALGRWRPGSAASWRTSTGTTGGPLRGPAPPWVFFSDQHLGAPQRHRPPSHEGRAEPCQRRQRHHDHRRPACPRAAHGLGLSRLTPLGPPDPRDPGASGTFRHSSRPPDIRWAWG